jgi:cytidylate kinase
MAIITISRSTFSGGKALAEHLTEKTGLPCFSREMITSDTAREYGISEAELTATIQKPPPFWQQIPGKRISYLKYFTAILLDKANGKDFIYHGYAGHLLLEGISHVVRVRVIADMDYRIKAAMTLLEVERDKAIAYIEKVDKERDKVIRFFYGVDWGDPALYDLIINLERMSVSNACNVILHAAAQDAFQSTEASKKALNDLTLSSRVWGALAKNSLTSNAAVKVFADNGVIRISGNAGSGKVVDAIPEVAAQVEGVKEVVNEVGMGGDWYW